MYTRSCNTLKPCLLAAMTASALFVATGASATAIPNSVVIHNSPFTDFSELRVDLNIDAQIDIPAFLPDRVELPPESSLLRGQDESRVATTTTMDSNGVVHAVSSRVVIR